MIRLGLRIFFVSSLLGCAHPSGPKVYVSKPDQGGAVRSQSREVVPYASTDGWFMIAPSDLEQIVIEASQRLENQGDK